MKRILKTLAVLSLASAAGAADEPGAVIFADSFDSVGTFAENWLIERKTHSEGGVVKMAYGAGALKTRVATPIDFVADVHVTLDPAWSQGAQDGTRGWAGLIVKPNYYFAVKPDGTTFLVWRLPGEARSQGKYLPIPGYAPGQPVHLRVIRKALGEGVKYTFWVNGRPSGDFIAPVPELVAGADGRQTYDPPQLVTYRENVEFDDFALCAVKRGDDSPNMITNSGFEFDEDGIPPFFCLQGNFDWARRPHTEYARRYLKRFRVDAEVKHSGRQSLRVAIDRSAVETLIRPWGAGTVKGKPGIFSVWMKASVDGLPVTISYGEKRIGKKLDGSKEVRVDREWRRYEVTRDELPGRGVYSLVGIRVDHARVPEAVLWIDDLQVETVPMPAGGFDPAKTYASAWRPADSDKGRFDAPPPAPPKPPPVDVRRLPAGVRPTVDLDRWTAHAAKVTGFYQMGRPSSRPTEGYLACDDTFLYVAYRCRGEKAKNCQPAQLRRDDVAICSKPSVETFFTPYGCDSLFQLVSDLNGNKLDLFASDFTFNGRWTSAAKVTDEGIDILQTFPLADFAALSLKDRWGFNLCRNLIGDGGMEWSCTAKVRRPAYNMVSTWRELRFPAGVLDRYRRGPEIPPYGIHRPDPSAAKGRRRLLGRLNFYMREPEARFRVFEPDGRVTEHALDIRSMPLGTNSVTVAGFKTEVVKLPYWKGATQINRWTRSIVHNGAGVLPTGFLASDVSNMKNFAGITNITDFLLANGFRQSMNFCHARREYLPMGREFVRCCEARGIGLVVWGSPFFNRNYPDMVDAATFVRELKGDNILSQLVIDEPELWTTSAEAKRQLVEMKKRYPYTPVQMNSTRIGIPQRFADLKTDILMLDDYLANNEGRTVWSVVEHVDQMLSAGEADGKPPWFFIESGVVSLHFKSPTYAEQIAQSWGCLAAGCTGLYWYEGFPTIPGAWRAMVDVNREVQSIKDVFLSEELCAQVSSDVERKKVISLTKKHAGAWYVITCNLEPSSADVFYTLPPEAPRDGTVDVLFENRTVPLASGRFSDAYRPLERHVYRISVK